MHLLETDVINWEYGVGIRRIPIICGGVCEYLSLGINDEIPLG